LIILIKSRRMRWAGHVARMGEKRNELSDKFNFDSCRPISWFFWRSGWIYNLS
jgi:hypothetical protein